jgi:hypothetical protein
MKFFKWFFVLLLIIAIAVPAFAAKRVVVVKQATNGAQVCYTLANWFAITTGQQAQTAGSIWTGASAAENTAIQNGSVLEEISTQCFAVGQDVTTIKAALVQSWTVRQSQINGIGPAQFQGVFFDSSTGWSQ